MKVLVYDPFVTESGRAEIQMTDNLGYLLERARRCFLTYPLIAGDVSHDRGDAAENDEKGCDPD